MAAANHYELLEVPSEASTQELRRAFRSLSKRYHPDTTELPEDEAREAFRRLQQAYLTLSDPERRRSYDATLRGTLRVVLPQPSVRTAPKPVPVRRPLSGGEWFALLLLVLAVAFSLVLGVGLAWSRGVEFLKPPSWVADGGQTEASSPLLVDVGSAATSDPAVQPPSAGSGALAG
ncbi:J domain-containing protein [Synechococcus sp. W4D4]|uniref:J domain-containing protein n=1 Tax=Synechococcus sp. W4D4 TaxID=3392294 RepID=UPI0039E7982D